MARSCGIPQRTMASYCKGETEPRTTDLVKIARAMRVSLEWLAAGEGPMQENLPISANSAAESPAFNRDALADVIEVVEEWLRRNGRTLPPSKKAEVFTELYEMAIEDSEPRSARTNLRVVERILRLVS
nr:transcriptional regulator [Azospirillum oleiclasticum]